MFLYRRLGAWEIDAPAKLNLYLEVLGRRSDGYHSVETLMAPIAWYDRLRLVVNPSAPDDESLALRYHASTPHELQRAAPIGNDNLVLRAARLLADRSGVVPRGEFELLKRIPVGAGMGGGSSDAAAALLLANEAWRVGFSIDQLAALGAELGSDVPFFLYARPAIGRGRGEKISPTCGLPKLHLVVIVPPVRFMTAEIFARLTESSTSFCLAEESSTRLSRLTDVLRGGAVVRAGRWMVNRLQEAACESSEWVAKLDAAFRKVGCAAHQMTGSGSGYFGVASSARHARSMAARLSSWKLGIVKAIATA